EFYERIASLGTDGLLHNLNDEDMPTGNLNGTAFLVTNKIGNGNAEQEVRFMVWIKTKNVSHLTVNGVEDTLRVDPYQYYMYLITGDESLNPFPSTAMANYYDEYTSPIQNEDGSYDTIYDDYDNIAEEVFIRWNRAQFSEVDFDWNNDNAASDTDITVYLDNDKYEGNFTWQFKTKLVILRNEVQAIYFDDALTQTTYFIDPFDYLLRISNGETAEDIYPSEANVLFTNGTVRKMPIQWIGLEKFAIYDYSSKVAQLQVRIGFDATAEGNLSSMIKGNLVQTTYVNVKVENLTPVGFDVAGSEYSKNNNGEEVFYIDPIQYLYYGVDPFPSIVTMVYESEIYENGKTTDLHVTWDFDRSLITMYGGKYQALIKVSDDLDPYVIDVEVLDRSNLQVAVDYVEVDPYKYKTAEDGSRIYSSFSSTSY
ncbi:MAG: hypothetical protein K2J13_02185, partial [Clostridia bacterium]|nr:hypothetical protein [Clostridia bacterium]